MINVKTGTIQEMTFQIDGNNQKLAGDMNFFYDNLNVELLDENLQPTRKVTSGFAQMLIKNQNLPGETAKVGRINYARDRSEGFFHHLQKGVIGGIQSTILPGFVAKALDEKSQAKNKGADRLAKR